MRQRSDADIDKLNAHMKLEEEVFVNNDRNGLIRLSGEFHLLAGFMQSFVTESILITAIYGQHSFSNCPPSEHRDLVKAIKNQHPQATLDLILAHLNHIEADLAISHGKSLELVAIAMSEQ